jgi:thymidylate synthase (FAD)
VSDVELIAYTILTPEAYGILGTYGSDTHPFTKSADHLAEIAGRECYQSFDRPNAGTASNADYLANVIRQGHTSVLAHASFTFRFTDVSRSLTHELIRHRFLAFSELSQRYVDMSESYTVVPPLFRGDEGPEYVIGRNHAMAVKIYEDIVESAVALGATRKEARQAARCVLPGGTNTSIIVSGNVRAWRDFIAQRNTEHADAEIRGVAAEVLRLIAQHAPNSVSDLQPAAEVSP